jgi:hypothetical protein
MNLTLKINVHKMISDRKSSSPLTDDNSKKHARK